MRHKLTQLRLLMLAVLLVPVPFTQALRAQMPVGERAVSDSLLRMLNTQAARILSTHPDSSITLSQRAEIRALALKDTSMLVRALNAQGKAYYIKGSYEQSLKYSTRGMALAEMIGDRRELAISYNDIGLVYLGHEQYDLALKEFLRAEKEGAAIGDSVWIASPLFNAGICYDHHGEYEKALHYFHRALVNDGGKRVSLMSINRLGETWFHLNHWDTAVRYYRQVLADPRSRDESWEQAFAYAGLAQVAFAYGDYDSAVVLGKKSYEFARKINAKWDAERAAKILAESYAALHDWKKAYEYMQADRLYNDSLYNDSREQVVNFLKLQDREKENMRLQAEADKDKKIIQLRTAFFAGACLLALLVIGVAVVLYRNFVVKSRMSNALMESNKVKDQLFSVISHDLRSPMASIQQMLEFMKGRNMPEEERAKMFDLFYRQVIHNNNMLNNLLQWVSNQMGSGLVVKKELVDPSQVLQEVLSVYEFLAEQKKIRIENRIPSGMVIRGDREHLKIIIQNIVGNAVKFTPAGGKIEVFHSLEGAYFTLHVQDTGVGIPAGKLATLLEKAGPSQSTYGTAREKGTGIGLQLVRQFVERNDGTISIVSEENKGTETRISFLRA